MGTVLQADLQQAVGSIGSTGFIWWFVVVVAFAGAGAVAVMAGPSAINSGRESRFGPSALGLFAVLVLIWGGMVALHKVAASGLFLNVMVPAVNAITGSIAAIL